MRPLILILSLFVAVTAGSWSLARSEPRIRTGQQIFDDHCARCHGLTGKGNGPDAAALVVPPANLQGRRSRMRTDLELLTIIEFGIVYSPMHGWQGRLTEDEMLELVGYIRTLAPFDPL